MQVYRLIGVGFCEEDAALNEMLGFNQASWGYHGDDGHQFSGEIGSRWGPRYQTGEVIGCGVDFDKHIAFYTKNGEVIGEFLQCSLQARLCRMVRWSETLT